MTDTKTILKELQYFTSTAARKITYKPITVTIGHRPGTIGMTILPEGRPVQSYSIIIDKKTYDYFVHDLNELKRNLLHELAHIPELERNPDGKAGHGKQFKEVCQKLGVPKTHSNASLHFIHSKETEYRPVLAKVQGNYPDKEQAKSMERTYKQRGYITLVRKMENGMYRLLIEERNRS
jgi:predicted SprT family Zn-dependent metalloprotease